MVTAILEAKQRGQVPVKPEPWSEEQPTPDETPPEPGHWSRAVSWEIFPSSRRFIAFQCVLTMNPWGHWRVSLSLGTRKKLIYSLPELL